MRLIKSGIWVYFAIALFACDANNTIEYVNKEGVASLIAKTDRSRINADLNEIVDAHFTDPESPYCDTSMEVDDCFLTNQKARGLIVSKFKEFGLQVKTDTNTSSQIRTDNIIAEIPGKVKPQEIIIATAHYDAYFDGADDNSSGMSVLLESARILADSNFERTIRFVGFDLEELGLVGSNRYVASLAKEDIKAVINFECVGYASEAEGSQQTLTGFVIPDIGNFIAIVANGKSSHLASDLWQINKDFDIINMATVVAPSKGIWPLMGDLIRSDHAPFWFNDIPAVMVTDTADLRNPNYHTAYDTIDKLDMVFLEKVVKLSVASIASWARGPL